jgi:hypothetical protein
MKMHNDPHSWTEFIELLHSWWRGETPMGAVCYRLPWPHYESLTAVAAGRKCYLRGQSVGL